FHVLGRPPRGRPLCCKARAGLRRPAPVPNFVRLDIRFPFPLHSPALISAIPHGHPPNGALPHLSEAARGTPSIASVPAECVHRCRNVAESLCIQRGRRRPFRREKNFRPFRFLAHKESLPPPGSAVCADIHRYLERCKVLPSANSRPRRGSSCDVSLAHLEKAPKPYCIWLAAKPSAEEYADFFRSVRQERTEITSCHH